MDASSLRTTVAQELAAALERLAPEERAALARHRDGVGHAGLAAELQLDEAQVATLLATARLALRAALRGAGEPLPPCAEHTRALVLIARRQDGEPTCDEDEDWLIEHLSTCAGCGRAHAAMLEAAACYRAARA